MRNSYLLPLLLLTLHWHSDFVIALTCSDKFALGDAHACALNPLGPVLCWGRDISSETLSPTAVSQTYSSGTVVKVQCGSALTCVQFATGSLQCWGLKGNNETIPPSRIFSTFSLGSRHGCGIEQSTSRIYCWGLTEDQRTNAPLGTFISVSSGAGHNCAIMTNYSIICWGFNPYGQANSFDSPSGMPSKTPFIKVSAGLSHTCGIVKDSTSTTQGVVKCWGHDNFGQSNGAAAYSTTKFLDVAAGLENTCAVAVSYGGQANKMLCWGSSDNGQSSPTATEGWQAARCGDRFCCGITSRGSMQCWGDNQYGRTTQVPIFLVC
mmetsp:Transcript_29996/g.67864  ORF Transcript_29996/g.67864 Transcript_29996/m.67864 type:complete len:322 (-) Transcript_29996:92-1057(-)